MHLIYHSEGKPGRTENALLSVSMAVMKHHAGEEGVDLALINY